MLRFFAAIGFCVSLLLSGWGCIPTFQGLRPVTKQDLKPKKKSKHPAEILFLNSYQREIYGQVGESRSMTFQRRHMRIRVNTRKGFSVATQTLRGNVQKLRVRTTCADGRVAEMDLRDVQEAAEKSKIPGLYKNDKRSTKFVAPGVGTGCIIDFFWEKESPRSSLSWRILQKYPTHKAHYRYEYQNNKDYRADLYNTGSLWVRLARKGMKPNNETPKQLTPKEKEQYVRLQHDRAARRVDLYLKDIPAALSPRAQKMATRTKLQPGFFSRTAACGLVMIRTRGLFGRDMLMGWRNIDESYKLGGGSFLGMRSEVVEQRNERKTSALAQIAARVAQKAPGFNGKVWAVYDHLRKRMTRTAASRSPRSSNKLYRVYQLGRGSAYEINMLYIVMLRSLDIRAYPALLARGNETYHEGAPVNHVFTGIGTYIAPQSEGKWEGLAKERQKARKFLNAQKRDYEGGRKAKGGKIVDPSQKTLPFGLTPKGYENTHAYVLDGMGGRFAMFPEASAKNNQRTVDAKIQIQADGTWKGTLQTQIQGQDAVGKRSQFVNLPKSRWAKKLGGEIKKACGAQEEHIKVTSGPELDLEKLRKPYAYTYSFSTPPCVVHSRSSFLFKPLPSWLFSLPKLRGKHRLAPINFGYPRTEKATVTYTFPQGYRLQEPVGKHTFTAPGLSAEINTKAQGNSFTVSMTVQIKKRMLAPEYFKKARMFFGKIHKLLKREVFVSKASAKASLPQPKQTLAHGGQR